MAWLVVCIPAGAAAGWGLVEFLPRYPAGGYDGGFAGDLILFGGMMALAQAPFIGIFGCATARTRNFTVYLTGIPLMVAWVCAGFVGWTLGAVIEVMVLRFPYYSGPDFYSVFGRSVRWFVMGILQRIVLAAACFLNSSRHESRAIGGWRLFFGLIIAWAVASAVGGFFFETWYSFDNAFAGADTFGIRRSISEVAEALGAASNIAEIVVPFAIMLPLLYGPFTGAVIFSAVQRIRRFRNSP